MSDRRDRLARELAGVSVPDADAAEQRARRVVLDAFEAREPTPARRRRSPLRLTLGLAGAALLVGVAAAASPSTSTIRRFVRDAVAPKTEQVPVAPMRLPGGGSLLVRAPLGAPAALWVVRADGSRRRLGPYRDGAWSPHARFVVATAGRRLVAIDPHTGKLHWSHTAPAAVSGARWSLEPTVPPCCRVAYLTAGSGRASRDAARDRRRRVGRSCGRARRSPGRAGLEAGRSGSRARLRRPGRGGAPRRGRHGAPASRPPYHHGFRPTMLAWSADGRRLLA